MFPLIQPYIKNKVNLFQEQSRSQYDYDLDIEQKENEIVLNKVGHVFTNETSRVRLATISYSNGRYIFDTVLDDAEEELLESLRKAGIFEKHRAFDLSKFTIEFESEQELIDFMDKHIWPYSLGELY